MNSFFSELKRRNYILFWFGWMNLAAAAICVVMYFLDDTIILGINAWLKPLKFYISITVFSWTMGWYLEYLQRPGKRVSYSIMVVVVMTFEMFVITWQASQGRLSHFNLETPVYAILFSLMGIAITILGVWTGYITYLFFRKKQYQAPIHYIWAIRAGLIIFIIYSFEGGLMAQQLSHSVGGADGSEGIPLVNWSRKYGDLRVAHFFGMHGLQIIPLLAYYVLKNIRQVMGVSIAYFVLVTLLFIQALYRIPLIS